MLPHVVATTALCFAPNKEAQVDRIVPILAVRGARSAFADKVEVRVTVDARGQMIREVLAHSAGDAAVDQAAMAWARTATYMPKMMNCRPVSGTYDLQANYDPKTRTLQRIFAFASPSPTSSAPPAEEPQQSLGYARFCSPYQGMSEAQFDAAKAALLARNKESLERVNAQGLALPTPLTDAEVIAAVRASDTNAQTVRILIKKYQMFGPVVGVPAGDEKSDAVQIQDANGSTRLVLAVFSKNEQFLRLQTIGQTALERPYQFARFIAAYMLLNDVLASDTPIPRRGCARAFSIQLDMPGILPEIDAAVLSTPVNDPHSQAIALQAYRDFADSRRGQTNDLTRQTLNRLGRSPQITFIYRDHDTTPSHDPEVDVVRLQNGNVRTYASMTIDAAGKGSIGWPALCVVGDQRCAAYYAWP